MSWMKRPPGGAAPPAAEQQAFAAAQAYGNQPNMYPNYHGAPGVQQQQMWPAPQQQQQPQYGQQQYGQTYPQQQQQNYNNGSNQFYQTSAPVNQNYTNQNYENAQQGYQQNYYQNQPHMQQTVTQQEGGGEGWEDNWGWGWEDSAKNQKGNQVSSHAAPQLPSQPADNANIIEESFAPSNNWNWSMEEKTERRETAPTDQGNHSLTDPAVDNHNKQTMQNTKPMGNSTINNAENLDVRNLSDREAVKQLPNLAPGKRFHLEDIPPQWSIESQMSQDSSDGPTQSDEKYRSENPSRNSSKDSPGPTTDSSNFQYSQASYNETELSNNEWSNNSNEDTSLGNKASTNRRKESHGELLQSMQEMNLGNHELPPKSHRNQLPSGSYSSISSLSTNSLVTEQSQSLSEHAVPSSAAVVLPPPAPVTQSVLPPPSTLPPSVSPAPPATSTQHAVSSAPLPPPVGFPPSGSQNPFKHAGTFSHKTAAKIPPPSSTGHAFPVQSVPLSSPSVVNQFVQQDNLTGGFSANLETTPDNSERPDQPHTTGYRSMSSAQQLPDNLEIAPQNDRNEYLQTAHLSSGDYGENTDFSRSLPPPTGMRRMGVGQQEVEYSQSSNMAADEPPPGLARMVPGQQTESDNIYRPSGDFMDRQIDGQPTDGAGRPYRQADGQQTQDDYSLPSARADRRPIGLDRMVPGEPSNEEYNQHPSAPYGGGEQRVVTGVDCDFALPGDGGPSNVREQNLDGSDYSEPPPRPSGRNVVGAREASNAPTPDFNPPLDDQQREITVEGENLQDLNVASPGDAATAAAADSHKDASSDRADSIEYPRSDSRKHSINRVTSGEDSERDRNYKSSSRKDRDKHKSSRDHDRDREREKEGRYSRGEGKHDREGDRRSGRDDRRPEKDRRDRERDRRDRDDSPDARRHKRGSRGRRYETEDTDYYSDRERERRRYREGSYTSSKPPRPDDKERRYEDRERGRRYNTIERDRRYDDERDGRRRGERRDRFERRYRDIDPRKYGARHDDDRKKVTFSGDAKSASTEDEDGTYSPGSRPGSREAVATDEEEPRRRTARRRPRDARDPRDPRDPRDAQHYYDTAYGADEYAQRRQYEYYERLRQTDPAAYMRLYKQLMDPAYAKYYADAGYGAAGGRYDVRADDRGSVHSGRSSANGLKHTDTYGGWRAELSELRGAPSMRTDISDRELTTDMSLNLQLDESTVRSERMTPFKFITSHVKGCVGARSLVVCRGGDVSVLSLAAALRHDPAAADLAAFPGPLVKGVSHKSRVVQYCEARAAAAGGADAAGRALLWRFLALLLRQNGVVVGGDIAELLMKHAHDFPYAPATAHAHEARRESSSSRASRDEVASPPLADHDGAEPQRPADERAALDRLRELLVYGNRQEAIEWAMSCGLWGHALQLAADRRARAAVAARFVTALSPADPLHTLYHTLAARAPPAATCVVDESWGDWRPHAAIILANASAKPEQDRRALLQLGDTLGTRGLPYSAQFCYLAAGERPARHPLAPLQLPGAAPAARPRLSLLLADPRAPTLARHATADALHATEVYEYALSLSQDFVLQELTPYKLLQAVRLVDAGLGERALGYAEQAARALAAAPHAHSPALAAAVAALADRLQHLDPALADDDAEPDDAADSNEPSPRRARRWLRDVQELAGALRAQSLHGTPQHAPAPQAHDYQWADQTLQQNVPSFPDPVEETPDYATQYHMQQQQQQQQLQQMQQHEQHQQQQQQQQLQQMQQHEQHQQQQQQQQLQQMQQHEQHQQLPPQPEQQHEQQLEPQYADEWPRADDTAQTYADPYWAPDSTYQYSEPSAWAGDAAPPTITMPGASSARPARPALYDDYGDTINGEQPADHDADAAKTNQAKESKGGDDAKGKGGDGKGGWLGGILTKLSLRAPNQMILPDDKNPTIVWDETNKCWRDTASPADAPPAAPPAPPPSQPRSTSTPLQSPGAPPAPPTGNLYQLQKKNIKKAYVNVLGGATRPAGAPVPAPAPLAAPPQFFVPPPVPLQSEMYDPTQIGDGAYGGQQ